MLIYIASDHRGFQLKELLKNFLSEKGYEVVDVGNKELTAEDDYPDFAYLAAHAVSQDVDNRKGIVICGSGAGVDIVANKIQGIRSVLAINKEQAIATRRDDDTNILALSADYIEEEDAKEIVLAWITEKFIGGENHIRRIEKILEIEKRLKV